MTPEEQLKHDLRECRDYWLTRSAKGGIAQPTVIAGVVEGILEKVLKLFPNSKGTLIKRKVLKRK